jgi:hypothetical protein
MLRALYGEGKYYIIPSFFKTLMYLKKNKKEFALSFRTFGSDMDEVIYEFNLFCNGEHPCYNGRNSTPIVKFDGSKNSKDFRFKEPEQRATMYRAGEGINETFMVTGPHKRVGKLTDLNMIDTDGDNRVIRDHLEIFQTILETFKKNGSMAIQEDYPAWEKSGRRNEFAKLLMIDQADYCTHHIFFDDNADDGSECIVDVRDVVTGESLDQSKFMNLYVVKVHPHRAITEPDYFIKEIEKCEAKRDEEIARVEAGFDDEDNLPKRAESATIDN